MLLPNCHRSRWQYIIIVSIMTQLSLLDRKEENFWNQDADSAIERAKTDSCKKELKEFSLKIQTNYLPTNLKRTCKLDQGKTRITKVGCMSQFTSGLVKIEEFVSNSSDCHNSCFTYGHSHGGFEPDLRKCYCGDNEVFSMNDDIVACEKSYQFPWYRVNNGIYYPKSSSPLVSPNPIHDIRIAFLLILSGRSHMQVKRLFKNIYSTKHIYYIHVDKREQYLYEKLLPLEKAFANVILTESRFDTIWGGTSLIRMMIDAIYRLAYQNWDFLINLSESDFPIKPMNELENYLAKSPQSVYLKPHSIKGYKFIRKQGLDRNFYQCDHHLWRIGTRVLPRGIVYSGGSDWFALPKNFCTYVMENLRNSESLVESLMHLYNYTLLPAESFFHTIALNSEFCDRIINANLRLTNWHRKQSCKCQHKDVVDWCGCSPNIFRWRDLVRLKRTLINDNLFFSRKFDPTVSSTIITAVEEQLIQNLTDYDVAVSDTRYWLNILAPDDLKESNIRNDVLNLIGLMSLGSTCDYHYNQSQETQLDTVHLYFKHDRFVGFVFHYSSSETSIQMLIVKNQNANILSFDPECFSSDGLTLNTIEVGHGFDTGERLFRNQQPLNQMSDVIVYHEWLVKSEKSHSNFSIPLKFTWKSPNNRKELTQLVHIRNSTLPSKVSLAHRLYVPKPLRPGVWKLVISNRNTDCLEYQFPLLGRLQDSRYFDRKSFDTFFKVSEFCQTNRQDTDDISCGNMDWIPPQED